MEALSSMTGTRSHPHAHAHFPSPSTVSYACRTITAFCYKAISTPCTCFTSVATVMKRLSRCPGTKQPNATFAGSERRFVTMETKTLTTDFPIDNDYSRFITRAPVATQASSKCGQLPLWTPTIAVTDDEVHSVFLLLQAVGCEQFTSVLRNESHFVKFRGADYISVESNKRNNQLICQNLFQHNCCSCEIKKKSGHIFPRHTSILSLLLLFER